MASGGTDQVLRVASQIPQWEFEWRRYVVTLPWLRLSGISKVIAWMQNTGILKLELPQ
jgi:hypothetical protein